MLNEMYIKHVDKVQSHPHIQTATTVFVHREQLKI